MVIFIVVITLTFFIGVDKKEPEPYKNIDNIQDEIKTIDKKIEQIDKDIKETKVESTKIISHDDLRDRFRSIGRY